MIEYNELSNLEKQAINGFIQSIPSNIRYSSPIWFYKQDIDDQIQDNVAHHSDRIINFLLSNSFIKLRSHQPTYEFLDAGYKLISCNSIEKFYEKTINQNNPPSIVGNGNVVNIAGGSIHQSDITITFTEAHYEQLRSLGVDDNKIEELKHIVIENKSDKPTLKTKAFKWIGEVGKAVASKGLADNLPQIAEFIGNLIN